MFCRVGLILFNRNNYQIRFKRTEFYAVFFIFNILLTCLFAENFMIHAKTILNFRKYCIGIVY